MRRSSGQVTAAACSPPGNGVIHRHRPHRGFILDGTGGGTTAGESPPSNPTVRASAGRSATAHGPPCRRPSPSPKVKVTACDPVGTSAPPDPVRLARPPRRPVRASSNRPTLVDLAVSTPAGSPPARGRRERPVLDPVRPHHPGQGLPESGTVPVGGAVGILDVPRPRPRRTGR